MFIAEMVKCHETAIKKFKKTSVVAKDSDLKMFVDKMLPALTAQFEEAKDLMPK